MQWVMMALLFDKYSTLNVLLKFLAAEADKSVTVSVFLTLPCHMPFANYVLLNDYDFVTLSHNDCILPAPTVHSWGIGYL
jgi:hypothetical protein